MTLAATASLQSSASPVPDTRARNLATLPFARRLASELRDSGEKLPDLDRARARHLLHNGKARESSEVAANATEDDLWDSRRLSRRVVSFGINNAVVTYTTNVGIGSPATNYTLLIDTGSSTTWIGAQKSYVRTKTSVGPGRTINVDYGSGSFSGSLCKNNFVPHGPCV